MLTASFACGRRAALWCTAALLCLGFVGVLQAFPTNDFVARVSFQSRDDVAALSIHDIHYVNRDEQWLRIGCTPDLFLELQHAGWAIEVDEQATQDMYPEVAPFSFNGGYSEVHENYAAMEAFTAAYPRISEIIDYGDSQNKQIGGDSHGGNYNAGFDLVAMKVTNKDIPGDKPVFFLMTAIHSREITTPEMAMRYIAWLLDGYATNADARAIVDYHETYIVPHVNPDGHFIVALNSYYQRKNGNRRGSTYWPPSSYTQYGTDGNRNHSFKWNSGGSSSDPLSQTYHGPSAASEPMVYFLQDFVRSLIPDQRGPGDSDPAPSDTTGIIISMHSYSRLVLWPWGHTYSSAPNSAGLSTIGRKFATYNNYTPEQSSDLYPTSGDTADWGYGELGVPTYTFECGGTFMPSYSEVDSVQWPKNRPALIYAAKIAKTPYMTAYGPDALNVQVSENGNDIIVTARIDDSDNGGQTIAAAELYIDELQWHDGATAIPMTPVDGSFNSSIENVTATINGAALTEGLHTIMVYGRDSGNNWGPFGCAFAEYEDAPAAVFDITTQPFSVPYEITTASVTGTNNVHAVGTMHWTNQLNGVNGAQAAALHWTINTIPLAVGANTIVVGGTNVVGAHAGDSVVITRDNARAPFVDITTPNQGVPYETAGLTVQGTNSSSVVGIMHWTNLTTGVNGSRPAAMAWSVINLPLAIGANTIVVGGTNAIGQHSGDTLIVSRSDAGPPFVDISATDTWVSFDVDAYDLSGTANASTVGGLEWLNSLNGANGSVGAAASWIIPAIPLDVGDNTISVTATNALGDLTNDVVTITRGPLGSGVPLIKITTATHNPSSFTVAGTNNSQVVGTMWWVNTANGRGGTFAAERDWMIRSRHIEVGPNLIWISGTNVLGMLASDSAVIVVAGEPVLAITSANATVEYDTASFTVCGTNNIHVVGTMTWQNDLTGQSGPFDALAGWCVSVPLGIGTNAISVSGTNVNGQADLDAFEVIRRPRQIGPPIVDITTPDQTVSVATAAITLAGTNGAYIVGTLEWECYVGPDETAAGSLPATQAWTIADIPLAFGLNEIFVWGTNVLGAEGWDVAHITRATAPPVEQVVENLGIALDTDGATPILSWSNAVATIIACTNDYYSSEAGAWFIRAVAASSPWSDVDAPLTPSVFYRVAGVSATGVYDLGKMTIDVPQAATSRRDNWLAAPLDFIDDQGNALASINFDQLGLDRVVTDQGGPPSLRDAVYCQDTIGGSTIFATRGDGLWFTSSSDATNWYRNRMYRVIIDDAHTGAVKQITFVGRVPTNALLHVADVPQGDGVADKVSWCVSCFPWVMSFDQGGVTGVVSDAASPPLRDAVYSQDGVGGAVIYTTRGLGSWLTSFGAATNLYPGRGYLIKIDRSHTGGDRAWYQPRSE